MQTTAQFAETMKITGQMRATIRDSRTGEILRVYEYHNINPIVVKTMIINNLASAAPNNNMVITHGAVGSGTSTPAVSDTQLQTEAARTTVTSLSNANNTLYATVFFLETEANGTIREAGLFSDGTSSANTGIIVSRVSTNITKTSSETLTLDWTITIS